jgi:RNA polymerase sigma-70 factor (ECF subfamily)
MHSLDGLNLDQIGAVHRVHRATVARWIAAARESLLERTRKGLEEKLQLQGSEFESLMGLVRSQLDLSIHSFLKKSS